MIVVLVENKMGDIEEILHEGCIGVACSDKCCTYFTFGTCLILNFVCDIEKIDTSAEITRLIAYRDAFWEDATNRVGSCYH